MVSITYIIATVSLVLDEATMRLRRRGDAGCPAQRKIVRVELGR